MTFDLTQMRANRDAGTSGPWTITYTDGNTNLMAGRETMMCDMTYYPWCPENQNDWLRIAQVPAMEAEIERLTAEIERLKADVSYAEIDQALACVVPEKTEKISWNEKPLYLASLVKHIIAARQAHE